MRRDEAETLARDNRAALPDAIVAFVWYGFLSGGYILRIQPDPRAEYRRVHSRDEWEGLRPRLERAALRGAQGEREAS